MAIGLFALWPSPARAGVPFLTDDPGFAPKGWEVNAAVVSDQNVGETTTAIVLDLNYTLMPSVAVNLTLSAKAIERRDARHPQRGFADTDFKVKWRLVDEDAAGWWPAIAIAPVLTIPTGSAKRGVGDGAWRYRLSIQFAKTIGRTYVYDEVGYQWSTEGADDQVSYGLAAQTQVADKLMIGVELNGSAPTSSRSKDQLLLNVGAAYSLSENLQIQASLGRTVREPWRSGHDALTQVILHWCF